ncbi:VQ domain-containing protein [Cephalotus follicularis]|uniref:VQ domain-containing protein n=1 Tax=Cephalotus follicularis TaxID=3775 RepID=A0A1Q3CB06_CEPFO|nr:VQ domain-containing protein [Cephalotus follicularis]
MATSENLATVEPWTYRAPFADSWMSEAFARDTETLTKALQKSLSNNNNMNTETFASDSISPLLELINSETASSTPTVSNGSGIDLQTATKRQRNAIPAAGKVSKRKSRAAKRSQTTFITADPANFRQMVQQVTGIRFGNSHVPVAPILKPEPQRPGNRLLSAGGGSLPTLDTSEFLLDHHQQNVMVGPNTAVSGPGSGSYIGQDPLSFQSLVVADGGSGFDFDSFGSFPTLESWKVM